MSLPDCLTSPHLTTILTTTSYIPGLLGLLASLNTTFSSSLPPPLVCHVTSDSLVPIITSAIANDPYLSAHPPNLHFVAIFPLLNSLHPQLPPHHFSPDPTTTTFLDAARRLLFLLPVPIVYVDLDVLVLSTAITDLLALATAPNNGIWYTPPTTTLPKSPPPTTTYTVHACGNWRNKKRSFNSPPDNFNSGVMVLPLPTSPTTTPFLPLYHACIERLEDSMWNDTEEKLLNVILPDWTVLDLRYNLQKRAFHHNPALWNTLVKEGETVILHYVGGKPWNSVEELEKCDWEADVVGKYRDLFALWVKARNGEVIPRVPFASVTSTTSEDDQMAVKAMQERISEANAKADGGGKQDGSPPVAAVKIDEGANKYVLVSARDPSMTRRCFFVRSDVGAEYHKDAADPLVSELLEKGYGDVNVTGGGRILLDTAQKVVTVYGHSYGFGRADHETSADLIIAQGWYEGFEVTWHNEGY